MKSSIFIIDASVIKKMIEGKNDEKSLEVLAKLKELKEKGAPCLAITTLSSLLHAIWIADDNAKISNLKKVLETIRLPHDVKFKDEKIVMEQIINLAKMASTKKEMSK